MLGMLGNDVESLKIIGTRDMDINMRAIMDENDDPISQKQVKSKYRPHFNDAKEMFQIFFWVKYEK